MSSSFGSFAHFRGCLEHNKEANEQIMRLKSQTSPACCSISTPSKRERTTKRESSSYVSAHAIVRARHANMEVGLSSLLLRPYFYDTLTCLETDFQNKKYHVRVADCKANKILRGKKNVRQTRPKITANNMNMPLHSIRAKNPSCITS